MADDKHTPPWVLITVAIIGAVGVIIAAMVSNGSPKSDAPLVVAPPVVSPAPSIAPLPTLMTTSQPTAQGPLSDEKIQAQVIKQIDLITSYKAFGPQQSVTDGSQYFITSKLNTTGSRQVYRSGESSDANVIAESVIVETDSCTRQASKNWECSKMNGYDIGNSMLRQIVLGIGNVDGADSTTHGMNRVTVNGRPCAEYWMEQTRGTWVWRDEVTFDLGTFFPIQRVSNNVLMEGGVAKQGLKSSYRIYDVNVPIQISLPK
jgi:hypothetical protein